MTFSLTAASRKPSGAMMRTAPDGDLVVGDDAADAAVVVDVAVGVDDGDDRQLRRSGCRPAAARRAAVSATVSGSITIQPVVAADERDVRDVVAAHLVDAGDDLEQSVDVVELRLAPQARVHRRRRLALDEGVAVHVPEPAVRLGPSITGGSSWASRPRPARSKSLRSPNGNRSVHAAWAAAVCSEAGRGVLTRQACHACICRRVVGSVCRPPTRRSRHRNATRPRNRRGGARRSRPAVVGDRCPCRRRRGGAADPVDRGS